MEAHFISVVSSIVTKYELVMVGSELNIFEFSMLRTALDLDLLDLEGEA